MGKFDLCTLAVFQKVLLRYKSASVLLAVPTNRHPTLDFQEEINDKQQCNIIETCQKNKYALIKTHASAPRLLKSWRQYLC